MSTTVYRSNCGLEFQIKSTRKDAVLGADESLWQLLGAIRRKITRTTFFFDVAEDQLNRYGKHANAQEQGASSYPLV